MRWLLVLGLLAAPLRAQALHGNEYAAGSALNLALRGPWMAQGWRRPVPRFLLGQSLSLVYERWIDANAWDAPWHHPWRDVQGRLIGYLGTELVIAAAGRALR